MWCLVGIWDFFGLFSPAFMFCILTVFFLLSSFFSCLFHIHFLTLNIRFCIATMICSAWSGLIVLFQVFFISFVASNTIL